MRSHVVKPGDSGSGFTIAAAPQHVKPTARCGVRAGAQAERRNCPIARRIAHRAASHITRTRVHDCAQAEGYKKGCRARRQPFFAAHPNSYLLGNSISGNSYILPAQKSARNARNENAEEIETIVDLNILGRVRSHFCELGIDQVIDVLVGLGDRQNVGRKNADHVRFRRRETAFLSALEGAIRQFPVGRLESRRAGTKYQRKHED